MPRTTKGTGGEKRIPLNMRTTVGIRGRMELAAQKSGRSLAQEVEYRLEHSFDREGLMPEVLSLAFGQPLAAVLMLAARTASSTGRFNGYSDRSSGSATVVDSEWPADSVQLRTLVLALRVINDPRSHLATSLLANAIPREIADQEGESECHAVAGMLRSLLNKKKYNDPEDQFFRAHLFNLIEALEEKR